MQTYLDRTVQDRYWWGGYSLQQAAGLPQPGRPPHRLGIVPAHSTAVSSATVSLQYISNSVLQSRVGGITARVALSALPGKRSGSSRFASNCGQQRGGCDVVTPVAHLVPHNETPDLLLHQPALRLLSAHPLYTAVRRSSLLGHPGRRGEAVVGQHGHDGDAELHQPGLAPPSQHIVVFTCLIRPDLASSTAAPAQM